MWSELSINQRFGNYAVLTNPRGVELTFKVEGLVLRSGIIMEFYLSASLSKLLEYEQVGIIFYGTFHRKKGVTKMKNTILCRKVEGQSLHSPQFQRSWIHVSIMTLSSLNFAATKIWNETKYKCENDIIEVWFYYCQSATMTSRIKRKEKILLLFKKLWNLCQIIISHYILW